MFLDILYVVALAVIGLRLHEMFHRFWIDMIMIMGSLLQLGTIIWKEVTRRREEKAFRNMLNDDLDDMQALVDQDDDSPQPGHTTQYRSPINNKILTNPEDYRRKDE